MDRSRVTFYAQVRYGSKSSNIQYSDPLQAQSEKMNQMLKDHDRQVQEAVRRTRDKTKVSKVQLENPFFSGRWPFNTHTCYQE